jgi:DNA-binding NarL/FixJ family response regulator
MEELRNHLNVIRDFAHILQEHNAVLNAEELAQAAKAIEDQSEMALQALDGEAEARREAEPSTAYGLSAREREVLGYVAKGLADKQIAAALAISTYTVNKHVGSILLKMGAASRTEAGVRAIGEGFVG